MPELMFKSRQQADAFVGSMMQNGKFDQAAFRKLPGATEVKNTVAAISPATLMIAAGIMAMSKKLDRIEEAQRNMMRFLEKDKESKLRGNLVFLLDAFEDYKSNWNKTIYKESQYIKAQDVKQESKQNIDFYRSMLSDELKRKKFLVSRRDVKKQLQKVVEDFSNYRLAIYLFAFASYLEIILLENFSSVFLNSVSDKIRDDSFAYVELYTAAYTKMENLAGSSLESGAIKGAAVVSQGLGKVIEKIPIVERGQLDENLIAAGKKLEEKKDESIDDLLEALRSVKDCQVKQFIDLIETVNELHNGEPSILVDSENVYVQVS